MRRTAGTAFVAVLITVTALAGSMATAHSSGTSYVVRPGDTLGGIAARFGTTPASLARANGIRNPNVIVVGQTLTVTGGTTSTRSGGGVPARLAAHPERLALRSSFVRWSSYYGVPVDLLEALGWVESGWQHDVVSKTGAVGIGQLMPDTVAFMWKLIGVPLDPFNADQNIRMTARFLRYLLDATGGHVTSTLASYYQGLRSFRTGPVHAATLLYVATVLAVRPLFR